jgi:hypothetical protein
MGQQVQDKNQVRNTQIKIKTLVEREYLARIDRESTSGKGRLKPAYRVLTAGKLYLRSLGIEAVIYDKPTGGHLNHVLFVNDVILMGLELERTREEIELREVRHDFELKAMQLSVVPDAFIHLLIRQKERALSYPLLCEVDRGTESLSVIEKKTLDYLRFMQGEYQQRFKLTCATVVWFVTADIKRLYNIRATIEKALTGQNLTRLGEFFYLCKLHADMPSSVFWEPFFYLPFEGDSLSPLLPLSTD